MSYYYSGSVRKRFTSQNQLKIEAQKKEARRAKVTLTINIIILVACLIAASWIDGGMKI